MRGEGTDWGGFVAASNILIAMAILLLLRLACRPLPCFPLSQLRDGS